MLNTIARRQSWKGLSMSLFGFRTRDPKRDRETDVGRIGRLIAIVEELHAEMRAERSGMQTRYRSAESSAAFALESFENGDGAALSDKVDDLTRTMQRYHARISSLDRQVEFMSAIEAEMKTFLDGLSRDPHASGTKASAWIPGSKTPVEPG